MHPSSDPLICPVCGADRPGPACGACDRRAQLVLVKREMLVLVVLSITTIAGFFLTQSVAEANSRIRLRDAAAWFRASEDQVASGQVDGAVRALRKASAIDRSNADYRLALASALSARADDSLARQLLLGLRELSPESVQVNLQLARIEVRQLNTAAAVGYYQNALYGQWAADQLSDLPRIRVELIRYLLDHGRAGQALPELLVLSANRTDTGPSDLEMGQWFVRAGELRRGLDHFARTIAADPGNAAALEAAGTAAFDIGDYAAADRYFRAAPITDATGRRRTVTRLVLTKDPLVPRLSTRERRRRLEEGVEHARARLDACSHAGTAPDGVAKLAGLALDTLAFEYALKKLPLGGTADVLDDGLRLISQVESAAVGVCGPSDEFGEAILLIGRRHDVDPS